MIRWKSMVSACLSLLALVSLTASMVPAQTPSPALLVLEKSDSMMAIVDPASLKIVGRVPSGPDPHEIECSSDGKRAYISNYGGPGSPLHTLSVIDVVGQKAFPAIDLGALHSAHGLWFAGDKVYFTAETNRVAGRYDPATQTIDWVMGTGQDGTHMVIASANGERVFTSNIGSASISIFEQVETNGPGGPRKVWKLTNVPAGRGSEGFDLSPDRKTVWVANAQDGTVTAIDVEAKKATETFAVPVKGNRLKFTRDGQRVILSGVPSGSEHANVAVLEVSSHRVLKSFDFGGFSAGTLVVPDGSRAYIAVSAKDKVVALDLKKLEVAGELTTGKNPDGLAWAQRK